MLSKISTSYNCFEGKILINLYCIKHAKKTSLVNKYELVAPFVQKLAP